MENLKKFQLNLDLVLRDVWKIRQYPLKLHTFLKLFKNTAG